MIKGMINSGLSVYLKFHLIYLKSEIYLKFHPVYFDVGDLFKVSLCLFGQ